jgi:hypothetical protein
MPAASYHPDLNRANRRRALRRATSTTAPAPYAGPVAHRAPTPRADAPARGAR